MLYETPELDVVDVGVLYEIDDIRREMADVLRAPKRWSGGLRRTTQARAIRGSNSIEGYEVTEQDAAAAVEGDEPLTADERTWKEIEGYRRVLTYVLRMATLPGFTLDAHTLRTMHFMLLEHDFSKSPGEYRRGAIYVQDESTGRNVYEGPDSDDVPQLIDQLMQVLAASTDEHSLVRGAMAHLNFVMVHPFRDGNGRMARILQTLVLATDDILEPEFSSIEEWLGANTRDYYDVLAATGQGAWSPERDATLWLKFSLRAHHQQAQTLRRRFTDAERIWAALDEIVVDSGVPERSVDALFDAALGMRIRRSTYINRTGVEDRTATRDLSVLVSAGLLRAEGTTRGRYYLPANKLRVAMSEARGDRTLVDPYPDLLQQIRVELPR
ncbi:Fic family protein [Dermacoccus sp. Tok2021]|uniref:Fic family protein n=1 Tax=Dermacoccus sp. Tok2021 TaxID=2826873 RepID=UPI001CA79AFC|nr:Fic family protein [Dermacoccus sp. Tok2021]MBZ4498453.1 Fic family protein [Dermacoccus sp. Tok2021]